MYKMAIFDMDGTILNSLEDIKDCCNMALADFGCPTHPLDPYKYFVGNGAKNLVRRAMPDDKKADDALFENIFKRYIEYYKVHGNDKTCPYDGIPETLQKLKDSGVILGVLSNKPHADTTNLAKLHFGDLFDIVYGERSGVPIKPAPDAIFEILEKFGVAPGEVAYFGDTSVDIETGINAGLYTVGVEWGFRPKAELVESGAHLTIDKTEAIADIVLG